jgi:ABC-type amino acid transport substrate-binding protein
MKNRLTILYIAVMAIVVAGCGGGSQGTISTNSDLKGKVIGTIAGSASDKSYVDMVTTFIGAEPKEVVPMNRRSDLLTAILAGKIDAAVAPKIVTEYYARRNNNLKIIEQPKSFEVNIVMAVRSGDEKFKADLDSAITILRGNGTLKLLEDKWIINLPATNEPAFEQTAKIDGAKTVYVGASGDFAPLDYIAADGRPAGYNVALLAEIGKLLNVNFEIVSIETGAKFVALESKKIDAVFFHWTGGQISQFFTDIKRNYIVTIPYYTDKGGYFLVRK